MRSAWLGLFLGAAAANAFACGVCVEDKIAAVYDHGAIARALEAKHVTVFFAIDGALAPPMQGRILSIVESVPGLDRGSVRLSVPLASLALAYDPRRTSLAAVQNVLDKKLAPMGLSLLAMQVRSK